MLASKRWLRPLLWGLLLTALAGVAAAAVYQLVGRARLAAVQEERERAAEALPDLGKVPDFVLTNRDGAAVRTADLAGAPWIADFVFTRCASSCPLLSARLARLDRVLPGGRDAPGSPTGRAAGRGPAIRLVSFSVDPGHDTPEVLERYARSYSASRRWLFLTGGEEQIRRLSRQGFKLALEPGAGSTEAILHSTRFVLVDATGEIRGTYPALDPAALRRLTADAESLVRGPA